MMAMGLAEGGGEEDIADCVLPDCGSVLFASPKRNRGTERTNATDKSDATVLRFSFVQQPSSNRGVKSRMFTRVILSRAGKEKRDRKGERGLFRVFFFLLRCHADFIKSRSPAGSRHR